MNMNGIIYKIVNKFNNKVYIGQTIRTLEERWHSHVYEIIHQKIKTKLGRAIRKYGIENFSIEIIEETSLLDKREIHWISFYKSTGKDGYNIKTGGHGGPHARSTKNKISKSNKKRIWTHKMRKNMSKAIKKWHKNRGFVPRSKEFKKKISEANRNRKMPEKTKNIFQKYNKDNMKSIVCISNGKEYESIASACRDLNLNSGHVNMHLHGKCSHVKGLVFKIK